VTRVSGRLHCPAGFELFQFLLAWFCARSPDSDIWVHFGDLPSEVAERLWEKHRSRLAFPAGLFDFIPQSGASGTSSQCPGGDDGVGRLRLGGRRRRLRREGSAGAASPSSSSNGRSGLQARSRTTSPQMQS
jgi:hypothetical protein